MYAINIGRARITVPLLHSLVDRLSASLHSIGFFPVGCIFPRFVNRFTCIFCNLNLKSVYKYMYSCFSRREWGQFETRANKKGFQIMMAD